MGSDRGGRAAIYARQSKASEASIEQQTEECGEDADEQGWGVVARWSDRVSASRHTDKVRDDWPLVLAAIEAEDLDVLVLWESSRGDRDPETWLGLLRRCREHRVLIRVKANERTYDLTVPAHWKDLAYEGIDSAYESDKLSLRTRRGVAASARAGRPAMGRAPYGYRRTYDPATGLLAGQEPHPDTAPIVVEVFDLVARSVPLSEIARRLNERGIPAPLGGRWRRLRLRLIVTNPAYIGERKHKGETYAAQWPALVDEALFYAAGRVLGDPTRLAQARPGRQVHLLTYLALCDVCDAPLRARATYYLCDTGHVNIRREAMDEFVRDVLIERLAVPDAYSALRQAGDDSDKQFTAAEGEAGRLQGELDTWRKSAARGLTTPGSLAVIEADLSGRINSARQRAKRATVPPALRKMLEPGADLRTRWEEATLAARRDVIRLLTELRVSPAGKSSHVPIPDRLGNSRWVGDTRTWAELGPSTVEP